jgi:hypothetical protein
MRWARHAARIGVWWGNQKESDYSQAQVVDRGIILKLMLKK